MSELKESIVEIKKNRIKQQLLKELYIKGPNTVIEICKFINSSPPSISMLFSELMEEGWVIETGTGSSKSGRKPTLYGLNPSHGYVLIWSINKIKSKAILFNLKHEIVSINEFPLSLENNLFYASFLLDKTNDILFENGLDTNKFIGVGISMPGLIDKNNGYNFSYENTEEKSLNDLFTKQLKIPAFTINDAKAIAFGEKRFGLAKNYNNVLVVSIDWGVGLGILVDGEVFNGTSGFSGELGHIQVRSTGELCTCGKIGCLETITTTKTLIRRVKEELKNGKVSKITKLTNGDFEKINEDLIITATHEGDELCIDLFHEIGTELGKALSIAIHLFNPELIIIDGLLARADKFITIPIEQAINKYCLINFKNNLKVKTSILKETAAYYGAYAYVMEHAFETIGLI